MFTWMCWTHMCGRVQATLSSVSSVILMMFWGSRSDEIHSQRVAVFSEWPECIHQSAFHRDHQSAPVSGFGLGKTCACRGQQKVWCQVVHIPQEAEHLQLRAWRFGTSPVYDAEHNQRRGHSSLANKLFSRQL